MNVLLVGLRGSGKSTVGRRLAERLGRPFVELDERVLARFPEASVQDVWSRRGEAAWRAEEALALAECLQDDGQVIALGGGTPTVAEARRLIEAERGAGRATVVWLRCDPQELARRLRAQPGDRPPLLGPDAAGETAAVAARREPLYRALADLTRDVSLATPQEVAEALACLMGA